ncbi:putative hexosyltransferase [Helianthus annuus]|nr:GPI mannosyltransferase 3 [Helianthus annuus]XP_021981316.1 GPI mannosyltransferase 3 [Helianthus annuus]KAF5789457.1 putative hexosyltransferase [Helianthus annuus]KAJ0524834.1 putative hexosyltransferase [Helianthus annuus]KAJ0532776.1 putative hexosyltransferase [Helianthus annuus]KAJ0541184.1 putative hexosyltransferase [Helianthus annuus]KAJ0706266.1 putative hexosyltransferase [Helianthus annuus]
MRKRTNASVSAHEDEVSNLKSLQQDSKQRASQFPSSTKIFIICLIFRMTNSLFVQTYFNPDEHWQALEVAHRITFGYGHLTWEWTKGIRSYLHPMLFAVLYKVLSVLHLDTPLFMIKAPRLLQSVLSAFGDLYMFKLSHVLYGGHVAMWALFAQLTNWFMFYCITRTLSNSLETVLTVLSLYYWPCLRVNSSNSPEASRTWALVTAAIACAIRPTSAIIWIYVGLMELIVSRDRLKFIFLQVLPIGSIVLGLTFLLDRLMYGSWVFVPLNFLKFNFLSSGGDYYGTHPWHWYFTQGFIVMIFTFLPFMAVGVVQSKQWKLSGLILWVIGLYSILGHKEFRFVLPVLPIALSFSGYSLAMLSRQYSSNKKNKYTRTRTKSSWKIQAAVIFLVVTNLPMALYMSMVHQRGTEDVMNYLAKEAHQGNVKSVLFLTPCHATPYYSTLHQNLPMRFLDCSPSEVKGNLDESDRFMTDPIGFTSEFAKNWSQPSHIVLFNNEEKHLKDFLSSHSYEETKRFFHAHFKVDRDLQASVVVYALK